MNSTAIVAALPALTGWHDRFQTITKPNPMNTIARSLIVLLLTFASSLFAASTTPIMRGVLQSSMNGGGFALTNVISLGYANGNTAKWITYQDSSGSLSWSNGVGWMVLDPDGTTRHGETIMAPDMRLENELVVLGTSYLNTVEATGEVAVANLRFLAPRWTDILTAGLGLQGNPTVQPALQPVLPGSLIYAYYFDNNDLASFSAQSPHSLAQTNDVFPQFYFEPHVHVSMTNFTAANSNITFRLALQVARPFGTYTNVATYLRTNTIAITNASQHLIISFGNITNNDLQGHHSVIFRGSIGRLSSASADVGAGKVVAVDSVDIHIPFDQVGSSNPYSN
ncbi:MAG: hypothetical protein ACOYD4_04015 [Solirubrobacterales bacterium]